MAIINEPIIKSMLDNDTYKFTMYQAVSQLFSDAKVTYRFSNRGKQRFNQDFLANLRHQICYMGDLALAPTEYSWLKGKIPFFKPWFRENLKNYRFNPDAVSCSLTKDNDLDLSIDGLWQDRILWEVPVMSIISELYFKLIDTDWSIDGQAVQAIEKIRRLSRASCPFADFGSRRRRSYEIQKMILNAFTDYTYRNSHSTFVGTSNMHFAMMNDITPIGTFAHEWVMGNSVLEGLRNSNYYALQNWKRVYCANLGIALTDTYGTDVFLQNFTLELSKVYDGVRHDSGDPFEFADRIIAHYKKLGIDPMSKTIVFSDGLSVTKAIAIADYCRERIKFSFGIGTHFTNDFENSPALNIVIKIWKVNGVYVVKLSDNSIKIMGDPDAVRVANWTFRGMPLDIIRQ